MKKFLQGLLLLLAAQCAFVSSVHAVPLTTHPRLWITPADVPRLRQWAVAGNPVYTNGLRQLAQSSAQAMDHGDIPADDNGGSTYSQINTEEYAALFALMALVDPDPAQRAQWALRGRTLLMHVIDRVDGCMRASPPTEEGDFCSLAFSVSDRARWTGAAFPLAADWLQAATIAGGQPALSVADRRELRRVFLVWSRLSLEAYPNPYNNPPEYTLPVGTIGEPLLRLGTDLRRHRLRFAGNNYFAGHMRNMGMRALAIDPADDIADPLAPATYLRVDVNGNPVAVSLASGNGALRGFLRDVLGGWLFVQDYLLRHDSRGGLPQEGMEYASTSIGIPAQFLFALETAGYADQAAQAEWGAHVAGLSTNPFYRAALRGFVHSQSPQPEDSNFGLVYKPAWYGDGENYYQDDPIDILGPIALHAMRVGDDASADAVRWIERFMPPDGNAGFASRTRSNGSSGYVLSSLLYFLVFDPNEASSLPSAPDPRPAMDLSFWSEGMGRLLSRTGWDNDARWFDFRLSYDSVDHQHGDGNLFEFYRNGEWLTKATLGYGNDGGATDYKNGITVENVIGASVDADSYLGTRLRRGAQMPQNRSDGDPTVVARSESAAYSHLTGDATNLYNAWYEPGDSTPVVQRATDVQHVSRSFLWLKPDRIVVYDRVESGSAGRTKRFWLNLPDQLPAVPHIVGTRTTSTTEGGQHLVIDSLLPAAKTIAIVTSDPILDPSVNGYALGNEDSFVQRRVVSGHTEKFATRLRVEANGDPIGTRFLHVLQGTDATASADATASGASESVAGCATPAGFFEGAIVGTRAAWFARNLTPVRDCVALRVPNAVADVYVVGVAPYANFQLATQDLGSERRVVVTPGGAAVADEGGVLHIAIGSTTQPAANAELDANDLDFATVPVGSTRELTITLANRGTALLGGIAFTLGGASEFAASGGTCTTTLAAGATCTQRVRFAPLAAGYRSGTLRLASDAGNAVPDVPLHGVGEETADTIFRNGFDGAAR